MQTDKMKVSKPSSTTRSLDTRSTSCDKDDPPHRRWKALIKTSSFDSKLPHLRAGLTKHGENKPQLFEYGDMSFIEPVLEEEEGEVISEGKFFKSRLNIVQDLEDAPYASRQSRSDKKLRSRSTDMDSLPKITESKDEYLLDRHRIKVFNRKLNTLVDLSEMTPTEDKAANKRGSAVFLDCLTIEEEDAEDVQIEPLELLSNDNESSKISSPMSKSLSKKHLKVDECSVEGEEKKRKRFESDIIETIEEKEAEEDETPKPGEILEEAHKSRVKARKSLAQIRSEMVCQQDKEIIDILNPKDPNLSNAVDEQVISEEDIEN